ncbi:MAG: glutathione-disulfide reductase [Alphaproteobacteria bacterium]|nr:glutathione-disulfide reductase [Alphaproteobacteria bacterium]
MPGPYDYDLFTIGAGSGGVAGSRRAASYGAKVAIAEDWRIGGTCVLRGCVPKKLLIYGAHFAHEMEDARGYGWTVEGRLDWGKLIAAKNRETDRLEGIYKSLLSGAGVEAILGRARIVGPNAVEVAGRTVTAKYILLATGGRPERPDIPGIEHSITSNEALDLVEFPRRVIIVGGGYIAVEFAGIFRAAGASVQIFIRGEKILRGFDDDVRDHLTAELLKQGIEIHAGANVARIERVKTGDRIVLSDGRAHEADCIMYATGRTPNTHDLGLEAVGVHTDKSGGIPVDEWQCTTVPGIYAIGDVTNRVNLTPVAIAEGRAVAETLFNSNPTAMDHSDIPSAVFSQPPVGTVGISEGDAVRLYGADGTDVYKATFRPMKHTISGRDERTMMKLVVESSTGRVRGVHMVGADAPEIIQGIAIAVRAGLAKRDFDRTVAIHPTAAEEFVLMREKLKR